MQHLFDAWGLNSWPIWMVLDSAYISVRNGLSSGGNWTSYSFK